MWETDTIAAISTPLAAGGIGVIRISGPKALEVGDKIFVPVSGKPLSQHKGYTCAFGYVTDGAEKLDEAVASVFRAPKSYTGEDVVELSCHGGVFLLERVLQSALRHGAVLAGPGEFTKRAFVNGKMDLTQAEAVMDLIRADSDNGVRAALAGHEGHLSQESGRLSRQLVEIAGHLAAWVDYPEEDIEDITASQLCSQVEETLHALQGLLRSYGSGRMIREGITAAIVGRPNVGKSTLFNRLTRTRQAIVNEEAGTTRDRQYGKSEWLGREFSVVDTGGWVVNSDDVFEEEIRKQVLVAVDEADVILFLVDVTNGVTDLDQEVADILRRARKPVLLVANKTDNYDLQYGSAEFYSLGLGDPYCISALSGSGTGDLLDVLVGKFHKETAEELEEDIPRIAVVGRPNAGKSSIINAFIGEDRHIVTEIAGTTRDSIYTRYNKFGFDFYLVDTAGIRKKNKVNEDLEYYSVIRSIRAIENSDVCVLMLDATRGIESQDLNIFSLIQKNQKGLVVVVNKWDLVEEKTSKVMNTFEAAIRERLAPFTDFPIIFASALTKQRILKVLESARMVYKNRHMRIPTARLNEEMLPLIEAYPPPSIKGKYIKIKYVTQLPNTRVPSFVFFANLPQYVKEPYRRFLENKMREKWNLSGTPINIFVRQK